MSPKTTKILIAENKQSDSQLIREMLSGKGSGSFDEESVDNLSDVLEHLAIESYDIILLNLTLPDSQGLATLEKVQESTSELPIVIITRKKDESTAIQAVHFGAQTYIIMEEMNS